jgi:hypothetical protein
MALSYTECHGMAVSALVLTSTEIRAEPFSPLISVSTLNMRIRITIVQKGTYIHNDNVATAPLFESIADASVCRYININAFNARRLTAF